MSNPKLDGIEELERHQAAETFEIPDRGTPAAGLDLFGGDPFSSPGGGRSAVERVRSGEARALEDLYVLYPELGRGDWKLRVERIAPRQFHGRSTSGYLGDFFERMSMDDFSERFGGGQYKLAVMKPVPSGDTFSKSDYKQVKELRIVVPGDPSMSGIQANEEDNMAMNPSMMLLGRPSEAVEIERIRAEQKDRDRDRQEKQRMADRLEEERRRAMDAPKQTLQFVSQSAQRAFDDLKEHSNQQTLFWQGEVERLRGELNLRDAELRESRQALIRAESEASNTNRSIETAAMREMKERFEERYSELKDRTEEERRRSTEEHARKLEEIQREHRRQVEELTSRHAEERRTYESVQALERERVREESRQRVEVIEKARADDVRALRETYEARLDDIRRMSDRSIEDAKEQSRREVEAIRMSERANTTLTKETAATRSELMQAEMVKLRQEAAELRAELSRKTDEITRLVQAQHKPLAEALAEAKQTASLVGMVDAADVPSGEGGPWDKAIAIGQRLVENAPEILKEITKARDDNRAARSAAQRPPVQHQQMMVQQQQQQQRQAAPQRYAPPAPRIIAPPAESSYTPPPLGGAAVPIGTPVPIGPAVHQVASPLQPGSERAPTPIASTDDAGSEQQEVVNQPMVATADAFTGAATPPAPAESGPVLVAGMTEEAVKEFFGELERAVRERVPTEEMFAQGFVGRVGIERAAELAHQFNADVIVDIARRSTGGQSRIVTREGQRYVRRMIGHVEAIVAANRQQAASA